MSLVSLAFSSCIRVDRAPGYLSSASLLLLFSKPSTRLVDKLVYILAGQTSPYPGHTSNLCLSELAGSLPCSVSLDGSCVQGGTKSVVRNSLVERKVRVIAALVTADLQCQSCYVCRAGRPFFRADARRCNKDCFTTQTALYFRKYKPHYPQPSSHHSFR